MTYAGFENGPVIIVGAGAVGLTLALHLHHLGIPVVALEQRPGPAERGRSSTLLPWALEMFEKLGVLAAMLEGGERIQRLAWVDQAGEQLELDYDLVADDHRHPYRLHVDQRVFCGVLDAALPMGTVMWESRVSRIEQHDAGVVVQLDDRTRLHGSYVVGADGLSSVVRDLVGIPIELTQTTDVFGSLTSRRPLSEVVSSEAGWHCFHTPSGWTLAHRLKRGHRILLRMPDEQPNKRIVDDGWLQDRLGWALGALDFEAIEHRGVYTVQHRLASKFVAGRVYLAGDAAHVTFPADGSALNMGLLDAYLLARAFQHDTPSKLHAYGHDRPTELRPWVLGSGSRPGMWSPNDGFPAVGEGVEAHKALLLGERVAALA